uniref:ELL-associated factor 1-like isoform X2 n=1 Tax=Ciona intestinalis TaxID=7719 RepID=UPI0005219430|nr:ELL-associated factor 1-like isoform X2 [Ciona intestinalis]|eukprot:XP_026690426.1 ELL-associated factor 1-like isoform X2 [Ciona intestinalis]
MDSNLMFSNDGTVHTIEMGNTFRKKKRTAFHTVRYDFKPASVDLNQEGQMDVGENNDVTVTLPHSQGSQSVYKGSKKPVQKECVLIYDPTSGSFTLERITSQIQVKKTRQAGNIKPQQTSTLPPANPLKMPKKKATKKSAIQKLVKQAHVLPEDNDDEAYGIPRVINNQPSEYDIRNPPPQEVHEPVVQKHETTGNAGTLSSSDDDDSSSSGSSSSDDSTSSLECSKKLDDGKIYIKALNSDFKSLHDDLRLSDSDSESDSD